MTRPDSSPRPHSRPRRPRRATPARPVWIDLANSPHVLFFQPIIAELERREIPTTVTARDFAQTVDLCRLLDIDAQVIGEHGGAGLMGKARDLVDRVRLLRKFARAASPCVAVSHNSYAQALAGRLASIPVVTAMDYEFQPANHLAFRCATLVAVPDVFPLDLLRRQGAKPKKVWRYPGTKEHIALTGFAPNPSYLREAGIPTSPDAPIVVVRPPADMALYHRFDNPLFRELLAKLESLRRSDQITVLLLARTETQAASLDQQGFGPLVWRGEALDGRQLIAAADAVVSAGGSMNREAAVLGTPAYSIYAGRSAAIDRSLVAEGRLRLLRTSEDVASLVFRRRSTARPLPVDDRLLKRFVDRLLQVALR